MATLGQRLREEREKRGLSIDDLAAQTRINPQHFIAIENDDVAGLPGGFFYRSFLRQYARILDMPLESYQAELDRSLESEASRSATPALPDRQYTVPPIPTGREDVVAETRRWVYRLSVLTFVVVVCSGVYTFWQRYQAQRDEAAKAAAQAPVQPQPAPERVKQEPPKQETKPEEPVAAPGTAPAAVNTPPVTTPPVTTPSATNPPPAAASPSGAIRLIVKATEPSWVGVWQGERLLFGEIMPAGESRGFGAQDRLRVRFGNAGGVEVNYNGQTIPTPGPRGQVRTVEFRADGYSVILPPPKPATEPPATPQQ